MSSPAESHSHALDYDVTQGYKEGGSESDCERREGATGQETETSMESENEIHSSYL